MKSKIYYRSEAQILKKIILGILLSGIPSEPMKTCGFCKPLKQWFIFSQTRFFHIVSTQTTDLKKNIASIQIVGSFISTTSGGLGESPFSLNRQAACSFRPHMTSFSSSLEPSISRGYCQNKMMGLRFNLFFTCNPHDIGHSCLKCYMSIVAEN